MGARCSLYFASSEDSDIPTDFYAEKASQNCGNGNCDAIVETTGNGSGAQCYRIKNCNFVFFDFSATGQYPSPSF